jgi:response regulator RpfG family c-di-GMP phosphodiesterase
VAIADVFDALSFKRVYKPAWEDERIRHLFATERGRQFDPDLTDLFLDHYADFVTLRDRSG